MTDRYRKVDGADQWFVDIMKTVEPPRFLLLEEVDMTAARDLIERARALGARLTYTHVVVRATAMALSRHPDLIRIVLGKQLVHPATLDLSLSVSSTESMSAEPTIILQDAASKDLVRIAEEIRSAAAAVRADAPNAREQARRLVRIIPSRRLRRWLVRRMRTRMQLFRERVGIFHITSVPKLQCAVPLVFPGIGGLSISRVEDRVVVRDGVPAVRPVAVLGMVGDHIVWKATEASTVIQEIKHILESGQLDAELTGANLEATFMTSTMRAEV